MKSAIVAIISALVAVGLAGCASESEAPEEVVITETSTDGAIRGLLVDDRFRPLMTGDADTILIRETADQLTTNENGEFETGPLRPGDYTLAADVAGHEAISQVVTVRAGEYTEATLVARRVISGGDTVIQQEVVMFLACYVTALYTAYAPECDHDLSSDRAASMAHVDFSGYETASHLRVETLLNQNAGTVNSGTYGVALAWVENEGDLTSNELWMRMTLDDGRYDSVLLTKDELAPEEARPTSPFVLGYAPWSNGGLTQLVFQGRGTGENLAPGTFTVGAGVQVGAAVRVLLSLMLDTDGTTADAFCGYCAA